jgi:hypothetical protein
MKAKNILLIALSLFATTFYAQTKAKTAKAKVTAAKTNTPKLGKNVKKIMAEGEAYYLTSDIGYDIIGEYNNINGSFNHKTKTRSNEPIAKLNADGTGLWQNYETSKVSMEWGIECETDGTPKKNESPNGAVYRLWYKIKEPMVFVNYKGVKSYSGEVDKWDIVQFSIHFNDRKMYILGERLKTY